MSRPRNIIMLWMGLIGCVLLRSVWPASTLEPVKPFALADIEAPTDQARLLLGDRIDVNHADAATLELLPGIGPATAQHIVHYRASHGPFQRIEDLIAVPGIGPSLLRRCSEWIAVSSIP